MPCNHEGPKFCSQKLCFYKNAELVVGVHTGTQMLKRLWQEGHAFEASLALPGKVFTLGILARAGGGGAHAYVGIGAQ